MVVVVQPEWVLSWSVRAKARPVKPRHPVSASAYPDAILVAEVAHRVGREMASLHRGTLVEEGQREAWAWRMEEGRMGCAESIAVSICRARRRAARCAHNGGGIPTPAGSVGGGMPSVGGGMPGINGGAIVPFCPGLFAAAVPPPLINFLCCSKST